MATKKKTNYIVYELKRLQKYIDQLQTYLDDVDLYQLEDRLDVRYSTQGNPIVKVIASKEAQVKSYRENIEKLPALYETLNRLKKLADTGEEEVVDKARGDKDLPGLFRHKMLGQGKKDENKDDKDDDIDEIEDSTHIEDEDIDDVWDDD